MERKRNPTWTRDELLLALDLYFRLYPNVPPPPTHPDVVELSHLLNKLSIHPKHARSSTFRNPTGVSMKLANFKAIDPNAPGVALAAVGSGDREVWAEFSGNRQVLAETATAIRRNADYLADDGLADSILDEGVAEGGILMRLHASRERNRAIVQRKKASVLDSTGKLQCEVCGFDFSEVYGDLGAGFIECHHTVPVAHLDHGRRTQLSDLVLVCANCHRMIHQTTPIKTIQELRAIVQESTR